MVEAILSLLLLCSLVVSLLCCCESTVEPLFPPSLCASQAANAAADALNAETLLLPPHRMAGSLFNRFVTLFMCQLLLTLLSPFNFILFLVFNVSAKGVPVLTLVCVCNIMLFVSFLLWK